MRRIALLTLTILIFPALCWGSVSPDPNLELDGVEWTAFRLDLGSSLTANNPVRYRMDLPLVEQARAAGYISWINSLGNVPTTGRQDPDDMVSMASFLWAELMGGVDVVAEVKMFSRQVRSRGRKVRSVRTIARKKPAPRCRWKIIVACRVDDNLELAARLNATGNLFRENRVAWQLSAADVLPDELGLTTVYRNGRFMIEADDVTLTETAMAKVVVRF